MRIGLPKVCDGNLVVWKEQFFCVHLVKHTWSSFCNITAIHLRRHLAHVASSLRLRCGKIDIIVFFRRLGFAFGWRYLIFCKICLGIRSFRHKLKLLVWQNGAFICSLFTFSFPECAWMVEAQGACAFSELRVLYEEAKQFCVICQIGYCCIVQYLLFNVQTNGFEWIFLNVFEFVVNVGKQRKSAWIKSSLAQTLRQISFSWNVEMGLSSCTD